MAVRTKSFSCGHKGLGRQCNRCLAEQRIADRNHEADQARAVAEAMRVARWDRLFSRQAGDSHRFPRIVADAAMALAEGLASGTHFAAFRPDRMPNDRRVLRFELPLHYRLIGRESTRGTLDGLAVMSHQEYDRLLPGDRPAR